MVKVLFVCLGNICRSPMAEGVFRKEVEKNDLKNDFFIDSAGTCDDHVGSAPDLRAQQMALKKGLSISHLIARQIRREDFERFDYIVAMDKKNYRDLCKIAPEDCQHKISLLLSYAPGEIEEVPDPYYGRGEEGFELIFNLITQGSQGLLNMLQTVHFKEKKLNNEKGE